MRYIAFIFLVACALVPESVFSANLVPCGNPGEEACQTCHIIPLISNVMTWLISMLAILAGVAIVYAGLVSVTSMGNDNGLTFIKKTISNLALGIVIALAAWLIVDTVLKGLLREGEYGVWNSVECVDQSAYEPQEFESDRQGIDLVSCTNPDLPPPEFERLNCGWIIDELRVTPRDRLIAGGFDVIDCPDEVTAVPGGCIDWCRAEGGQIRAGEGLGQFECVITNDVSVLPSDRRRPPDRSAGGACSTSVIGPFFGSNTGNAQCIIEAESSCGASGVSRTDVMRVDGRAFSFGPMQINLTVHELRDCPGYPATMRCLDAFSGRNYDAVVINEALYQQCAEAAQNHACNIRNGARIYREAGNSWRPWSTAAGCGLQ